MPYLDQWAIVRHKWGGSIVLFGVVHEHIYCLDGETVWTTPIQSISVDDVANRTALTNNTLYNLQQPRADWLFWLGEQGTSLEIYCTKLQQEGLPVFVLPEGCQ